MNGPEAKVAETAAASHPAKLELLRRTPPSRLSEQLAPELDEDLLRALVRGELASEDARLVYQLVHAFQSWSDAHTAVMIAEHHARNA